MENINHLKESVALIACYPKSVICRTTKLQLFITLFAGCFTCLKYYYLSSKNHMFELRENN